ncbi:MAG: AMP-dependent synthetase/ligase [Fidelibacterota bacterium]
MTRHILHSNQPLPDFPRNLAEMLNTNSRKFSLKPIFQESQDGKYIPLLWQDFTQSVIALQSSLTDLHLRKGERVAILSRNCQDMLVLDMAVMSMGAISVPIFAGYPANQANRLTNFCEPRLVVVADQEQFNKLENPRKYEWIIHFSPISSDKFTNLIPFSELLSSTGMGTAISGEELDPGTIALMMYTSGTMGRPKCVQLTHANILSQQAAMKVLWKLSNTDRILSYLPWHHSFGGIFEKFAAITNGAVLSLEHGFGKNIEILLDNWQQVLPTVFFSVPRIYQQIATRVLQSTEIEKMIFHNELRFIFTAAAPLPQNIAKIFIERNIPVIEGWGLTETSPCCTVTNPNLPRSPGVVGKPIPGISLKLADDGEIMVKGPNIMTGYYKNTKETDRVLTKDGWFYTGDVGELTKHGLRLIGRKDRIFKLSNAEKVVPTEIENIIGKDCAYISYAYVSGSGKDYPVTLLFPNKEMFKQIPDESQLKSRCKCPQNLGDFSVCLNDCLRELNKSIDIKYARPQRAMLIDYELSIENEELTPSMKLAPNTIAKVFKANIEHLYNSEMVLSDKVYVINLE